MSIKIKTISTVQLPPPKCRKNLFHVVLTKKHRNFDTKRIKVAVLLLFNRSIQRGTPGSSATICQREQHRRQAKMIWICSQSL